ncbi:hypothetical protein ACFX2B_012400 [Malus domestica]
MSFICGSPSFVICIYKEETFYDLKPPKSNGRSFVRAGATSQVKLTPEETKILLTCKSKAVREFTFGGLAAATVAWTASKKLNTFIRLNLSGGAAALFGLWSLSRSLNSCVNHILSQDGSRMQAELATIMVNKYQNDPSMMGLISKQFYSEKVFYDANSDQPTLRWRYRNYFSDNISHGRRTDYSDSQGDPDQASHGDHQSSSDNDSRNTQNDSHKIRFPPKQVPVNSGVDVMVDPFDCVFGNTSKEILLPSSSSTVNPPKVQTRKHRRSHRRRHMHHEEDVPKMEHT